MNDDNTPGLSRPPKDLRKLIDIPEPILADLKRMAAESGTSLKGFIEDKLIEVVYRSRNDNHIVWDKPRSRNESDGSGPHDHSDKF